MLVSVRLENTYFYLMLTREGPEIQQIVKNAHAPEGVFPGGTFICIRNIPSSFQFAGSFPATVTTILSSISL